MSRLPIQNHSKPCITEKRRNKAKYLTWNYIRFKYAKKTPACQTLSRSLDISNLTARVASDLLKAPAVLSDTTVWRSAVYREDLRTYWISEKWPHFSRSSTILLFTTFSKTYTAAVFSFDLCPTFWNTEIFDETF